MTTMRTVRGLMVPAILGFAVLGPWLDRAEATISLGVREMACRLNLASRNFDKAAITSPKKAAHQILAAVEKDKRRALIGPDAKMIDFTGRMYKAGIPLVAGTDGLAGFTLQRELEVYVQAGLTPAQALQVATYNGAKYARVLDDRGVIMQGKRADHHAGVAPSASGLALVGLGGHHAPPSGVSRSSRDGMSFMAVFASARAVRRPARA